MRDEELNELVAELTSRHGCHTWILYGSRAQGTQTPASDIDIVGFRDGGEAACECRRWREYWLDAWIKPEAEAVRAEDFLQLDRGLILVQRGDFGSRLLAAVADVLAQPMPAPPPDQIEHRKTWLIKTLDRIRRGDAEGWNRRCWLMAELPENHFFLQGRYFLGFKRSMQTLAEEDPELHQLLQTMYSEAGDLTVIEAAVAAVLARAGD